MNNNSSMFPSFTQPSSLLVSLAVISSLSYKKARKSLENTPIESPQVIKN